MEKTEPNPALGPNDVRIKKLPGRGAKLRESENRVTKTEGSLYKKLLALGRSHGQPGSLSLKLEGVGIKKLLAD